MELTKEIIDANGFTDEQVQAVNEYGQNHIAEIKKTYDDEYKSTANTNAQNIIGAAATGVKELTGFRDREKGEHLEVYNKLAFEHYSKEKIESLNTMKSEYDEKVKNFKGSEDLQKALNETREKFDALQAKEAQFEELLNSGVKDKYEALLSENMETKIDNAFTSVLPTFPESVNEYEKNGKWSEFKSEVLKTHNIEKVDGVYYAIDKENVHKQSKLSELVAKDSVIQDLLKGRQQSGINATPQSSIKIEGVPFEVPKEASSKDRAELIRDHLKQKGISPTDTNYSSEFSKLNSAILKAA